VCIDYAAFNKPKYSEKRRLQIQKMEKEVEPTLEEIDQMKEDIEREMKLNPIYKKSIMLEDIQDKHKTRMDYMEKNFQEKKKEWEERHKKFVNLKNKELEALNLDADDYNIYVLGIEPAKHSHDGKSGRITEQTGSKMASRILSPKSSK
jgi:hypothetical protein